VSKDATATMVGVAFPMAVSIIGPACDGLVCLPVRLSFTVPPV
jgi:hypothetical protein